MLLKSCLSVKRCVDFEKELRTCDKVFISETLNPNHILIFALKRISELEDELATLREGDQVRILVFVDI